MPVVAGVKRWNNVALEETAVLFSGIPHATSSSSEAIKKFLMLICTKEGEKIKNGRKICHFF